MIFKPFNQIIKNKAKYMVTVHMLKLLLKKFILFFFNAYKNERKEHKF